MSRGERKDETLDALLAAVRRGERGEFDSLMERYRGFVIAIIERDIDSRLRRVLETEDVVQDVMLAAYRGIPQASFASEAALRAWLERLARNRLVDLVRRHFKTQRRLSLLRSLDESVDGSGGMHLGESIPAFGPGATTVVTRREAAEALEAAIGKLAPQHRSILRLVHVERLSTREIASRLGKTPEAVRKALARALRACRSALGPRGPLDSSTRGG